jgi:RNA polymerase sigma-70 factor (ECF subfamily)
MTAPPLTRASLLVRLRDPRDVEAWKEFVQLYASVIYGFARKRGLQDADAADLMQEVLRSFAGTIGRWTYDPRKGTFRSWLFKVTRNKVFNFLEARQRQARGSGDSATHQRLDEQAGREPEEDDWDREYERKVFTWAAERIKGEFQPTTWQAFWLTAVEDQGAQDVGQRLKLSPGAVYVAKSRVLSRLREEIAQLETDR